MRRRLRPPAATGQARSWLTSAGFLKSPGLATTATSNGINRKCRCSLAETVRRGMGKSRRDRAAVNELLPRRRTQSVPGVAHLMVMHFGQVIRRVQVERLDVEPADGGKQGIGGDHAVA